MHELTAKETDLAKLVAVYFSSHNTAPDIAVLSLRHVADDIESFMGEMK